MKLSLLFCAALSLLTATLLAETPRSSDPSTPPAFAPHAKIQTEDNFRAFLVGTTWKWTGRNGDPETVTFHADGTVRNSWGWIAKFVVKSLTEVELRKDGQSAKMTFDKTYTQYDGIDFDHHWPLKGQREK